MVIKYISSAQDGTGDYIADGSEDQEVINSALSWGSNNPGNEIHLKGPFSYDIGSTVKIGSNTIFSGDSNAVLRLSNSCAWASMVPVIGQLGGTGTPTTNVEISGFQINCNEYNLYGVGGRIHGKGYYNAISIQGQSTNHASNIYIHDMKIYDSMGDGCRLTYCTGVKIQKNIMWNLQHCSTFCVDCLDIDVSYNDIQAITCSGTRFDNSQEWAVHNNNIQDWNGITRAPKHGEYGVQFGNQPSGHTTLTQNGKVYDNNINVGGCGVQIEDYLKTAGSSPQTVVINNNAISGGTTNNAAYFAGISIYSWGNGLTIQKNTISGSGRAGILGYGAIASGVTVSVKDNNILNTTKIGSEGGYGIWNKVPASLIIVAENNYLHGNIAGKYLGVTPVSESSSIISDAVPGGTPITPPEPDPDPDQPVLPTANFSSDVTEGYVPLTVQFTDCSVNATVWIWNFGDDGTSTEKNPVHTYLTAGNYTPKLTVSNAYGTDYKLATITVSDADTPLPPEPDDPYTGYQGIMMPSGDGHYIFQLLSIPAIGDSVLLFPMPGNDYALLKLDKNITIGNKITIVPDGKGNYYAIK